MLVVAKLRKIVILCENNLVLKNEWQLLLMSPCNCMQSKKRPYIDRLKQGQTKRWMHQDKSCSNSIRYGSLKIESHMTKSLLTGIPFMKILKFLRLFAMIFHLENWYMYSSNQKDTKWASNCSAVVNLKPFFWWQYHLVLI